MAILLWKMLLLGSRLLLGAIFLIAGWTKLADHNGGRKTLMDFGIPDALAKPFSFFLPIIELVVAILLIPQATAWWGGLGAFGLLLIFIIAIAINLILGRKPDCHCFGQLHSAPAGWSTLIRNVLLAVIACLIIWQGQDNPSLSSLVYYKEALPSLSPLTLVLITSFIGFFAFQGWIVFHLFQQQGRLLLRIEALEKSRSNQMPQYAPSATGLQVGSPAPKFELADINGKTVTLRDLFADGKYLLLIFSDPGCGPCNTILPEVASWQNDHISKLTIALVTRGTVEDNRKKTADYRLAHILLQQDREVAQAYQAHGTPAAVLLTADGRIASPLAFGPDAIRSLVTRTLAIPTTAEHQPAH